jgi:formamidopyrimidine-DNA glycosylase
VLGVKRDVKSVLMDQEVIAGVGNIYSDDILLQARINPTRRMDKLSPIELRRLFSQMRQVLETAIAAGAGSEQYVDRMPESSILPERKKGGHCPRCRASLEILKIGGRKAYYCPQCQNC